MLQLIEVTDKYEVNPTSFYLISKVNFMNLTIDNGIFRCKVEGFEGIF